MDIRRRALTAAGMLLLTGLLAACATGSLGGLIPFKSVDGGRGPQDDLQGYLSQPPSRGPVPVVILLHGCGGITPNQQRWANRLNRWGYASLILDSFGPRGVQSICAPAAQPKVLPSDRASDIISAALWLRDQPGIDGDRIAVLGNSHGGAAAAWVTQVVYQKDYPGLIKAAVDYYGGCGNPQTHGTVPLLALAGESDDWGNPAQQCETFGRQLRPDQPFELHVYPNVLHAFDNPRQQTLAHVGGHALQYNQPAADDSFQRVRAFLAHWLAPPSNTG